LNGDCSGNLFSQLEYISSLSGPWCSGLQNLQMVVNATGQLPDGDKLIVKSFPNPFGEVINFRFVAPETGRITLEMFDLNGTRLALVPSGWAKAGEVYTIQYNVPALQQIAMVYRVTVGKKTATGKVIPGERARLNEPTP
jgi:hypothetical protein